MPKASHVYVSEAASCRRSMSALSVDAVDVEQPDMFARTETGTETGTRTASRTGTLEGVGVMA